MRILSIETSADETAVSIVEVTGEFPQATYTLLGNALHSQAKLHDEYGGIFPAMAKREHAKAIIPLLEMARQEAELLEPTPNCATPSVAQKIIEGIHELLQREEGMADRLIEHLEKYEPLDIDLIAVTSGPGLEPALWVGVNFAKALATAWHIPVVSVNHMEGHLLASIFDIDRDGQLSEIMFPALALLISGGHTEFILMRDWGQYEKIGQTLDDAVGEAYDKVARLLGLPYPGGPEIEKLAKQAREHKLPIFKDFPRPMRTSGDLNFSFSGLKTAVRYAVADQDLLTNETQAVARDFEDAVTDVLLQKTQTALEQTGAQTFIVGGGVSASQHLRNAFNAALLETHPDVTVYFPHRPMSTDNSVMIALAGHASSQNASNVAAAQLIRADGNKSLAD